MPPAPYECAFHLHEYLRARGLRDSTELAVVTVQPMLMPNAGWAGSEWMAGQLAGGASHHPAHRGEAGAVEPGRVVLADGRRGAVRPVARRAATSAACRRRREWPARRARLGRPSTRGTLATSADGVFAVGDVNLVPLANGLPLPKAGVMAELQGLRVARAIAAELGVGEEPALFDGMGYCPVEVGEGAGAMVRGNWYAKPIQWWKSTGRAPPTRTRRADSRRPASKPGSGGSARS